MPRYDADLDALKHLRDALVTFATQQPDVFDAIDQEVAPAMQAIDDAEQQARHQVEQCSQELQNCRALQQVTSIDCTSEVIALHNAEEKLETIRQWQSRVRDAIADYRAARQRFTGVIDNDLPRARAYLSDRITALEAYQATIIRANNQNAAPPATDSNSAQQKE